MAKTKARHFLSPHSHRRRVGVPEEDSEELERARTKRASSNSPLFFRKFPTLFR